ncbi:DUF1493 family protein [Flavobacterium sp. W1B]|uniref:DUF1493 family protein n=1 Tax=Flavobacterium sp. W1B TaxID=3394146 RepID=UPI0039BC4297
MNTIENDVLIFFKKSLSNKLTLSSNLTDFCKNEDDAFYLFLEFFEVFKIEKGNLDVDKYFYSKSSFWDMIRFKKVKQEEKPKITIKHLIKVAEKKEWFDPIE